MEIASGSGQHALYFTEKNPKLSWHCTEISGVRDALQINLNTLAETEMPQVQTLNLLDQSTCMRVVNQESFDALYTANSMHIISWEACLASFQLAGEVLVSGGSFYLYGPFLFDAENTAPSNLEFDAWLRERDPVSGVRSFDAVVEGLAESGLDLVQSHPMPANNHLLVFRKR